MTGLGRLATVAALFTYIAVVMGGVVRVTGSGLGCPDWPLCHGRPIPPLEFAPLLEWTHRTVAATVGVLLAATAYLAWTRYRARRLVALPMAAVMILLIPQVLLGRTIVMEELPPYLVLVHLAIALILLALAIVAAVTSWYRAVPSEGGHDAGDWPTAAGALGYANQRLSPLVAWTVLAVFLLVLTGAYVRASGATWVCRGFPLCNGGLPLSERLVDVHMLHRVVAIVVGGLVVATALHVRRTRGHSARLRRVAASAIGLTLAQIAIGVTVVSAPASPFAQALHLAGASALWSGVVILAYLSYQDAWAHRRRALGDSAGSPIPGSRAARRPGMAYLMLTKPRIISLLLITTIGAMFLAGDGPPSLALVLFTLVGGALAAGGANAINMYLDRDIDVKMTRTDGRPIPAGDVRPGQALVFGLALAALSFLELWLFVNPLAATLSMGALLYYVFVYTKWLKRSTPSNIVIGGAAGAAPPLVGWTAVAGELSLLAIWLFVIIFYWTPPHFWALSLLIRREYERARVPMLPLVRGDGETRRQIVMYSIVMVILTVVLVPLNLMGPFYLIAALTLGGIFLFYAHRLWREATTGAARRLFKYSIYYLALLFGAMVVDHRVFL